MPTDVESPNPDETDRLALLAWEYDEALLGSQAITPGDSSIADLEPAELGRLAEIHSLIDRLAALRTTRGGHERKADTSPDQRANGEATEIPRVLGRFQIERLLGQGAHGVVYQAIDPALGRRVALKLPRPETLVTPELRHRFVREAEALARLRHPNIVGVHEAGELASICYFASAFCAGPNLAYWLASQTDPVPVRLAARMIQALAEAAHAAHSQGIIHRDIKPSNILLDRLDDVDTGDLPFTPKLADFGLARFDDASQATTKTGAILGTPRYMAPEQATGAGDRVGAATDVYALGAILYELLVQRPPFVGVNDFAVLEQVARDEPIAPRLLRPEIPRDLEAICLKCPEKRPSARYPSAAVLAADLGRYLAGEPTRARPIGPLGRAGRWVQRQPWIAGLGALVFSLLIAVATVSSLAALRIAHERDLAEQAARQARQAERVSADALTKRQAALEAEAKALEEARTSAEEAGRQAQVATSEATRAKREADTANRLSELLLGLFQSIDPTGLAGLGLRGDADLGRDLTSKELLQRAVAAATSTSFAHEEPIVRARLLARISKTCHLAGLPAEADQLSEKAMAALIDAGDAAQEADRALVKQVAGLTLDDEDVQRLANRVKLLREALIHAEAIHPEDTRARLLVASIQFDLAWVLGQYIPRAIGDEKSRDYSEAEQLLRDSLKTRRQLLGNAHPDVALTVMALTLVLITSGKDEAIQNLAVTELMPIMAAQRGGDKFMRAVRLFLGGMAERRKFNLDGAIAKYRAGIEIIERINEGTTESVPISPNHPAMLLVWGELAGTYKQNGQYREAEAAIEKAIAIADRVLPHGHPKLVAVFVDCAEEFGNRQEYERSSAMARRVIEIGGKHRSVPRENVVSAYCRLLRNAISSSDDAALAATIDECLATIRALHREAPRSTVAFQLQLLNGLVGTREKERGIEVMRRIEEFAESLGTLDEHITLAIAKRHEDWGESDEAQRYLDRTIALVVPAEEGKLSDRDMYFLTGVAQGEMNLGHYDRAAAHLERILHSKDLATDNEAWARSALATIALGTGQPSGAVDHCRAIIDLVAAAGADSPGEGPMPGRYLELAYAQFAAGEYPPCFGSIEKAISLVNSARWPLLLSSEAVALLAILKPKLPSQAQSFEKLLIEARAVTSRGLKAGEGKIGVGDLLFVSGALEGRRVDAKPQFARYLTARERATWDLSLAESAIAEFEKQIALCDAKGRCFPTWRMRIELEQGLGHWLATAGRWEEAEAKLLSVYERAGAQLASRHVIVLGIAADLVRLYTLQGRAADAEKFQKFIDDNTLSHH